MLLFYEGYIILVSHPNTNPTQEGLTSVNFGITKLSDAQRARLNLWSKEVYQHVSPEASVSHFPLIFFNLSGFSTLLVTTCLLRLFTQDFYHGTTMIDNTKTISVHVPQATQCTLTEGLVLFMNSEQFKSVYSLQHHIPHTNWTRNLTRGSVENDPHLLGLFQH